MSKVMNVKITGIIAEYNPLHAGHIYHMEQARRRTRCDYLVCVMGGNFNQRGEPALFDKFARVRMALAAGADAVFELSAVYAMRCAQLFARGGAGVLAALGADAISFGCETEDVEALYRAASLTERLGEDGRASLNAFLSRGESYPKALARAAAGGEEELLALLDKPNFVLALEYVKELKRLNSTMTLCPVLRTSAYRADAPGTDSASGIRLLIASGREEEALASLPPQIAALEKAELAGGTPDMRLLDALILQALRSADPAAVRSPDESEGLFNRVQACARQSASLGELLARVKCKRYTLSRIRRLAMDVVLNLPQAPEQVPYLRLLGARRSAGPLLKELDARTGGGIVSRASLLSESEAFRAECRVTDLWGLAAERREYRLAGREYTNGFITY